MNTDEDLHTAPELAPLRAAGRVDPVAPEVMDRAVRAVRSAAAREAAAPTGRPSTARGRSPRWRRRPVLLGMAAAAAAAALVVPTVLDSGQTEPPPRTAIQGTGPVEVGMGSCVEQYDPATLTGRSFAFDGTVRAIGPDGGHLDYASVTFTVNEWFRGGPEPEVTVALPPPDVPTSAGGPAYGTGTRLLVSGEPASGGAPLDEPLGWLCGFTRYYDAATAQQWRTAFAAPSP